MENNINNNIESKNLWTDFKLLIVSILDIRTGAEKTQTAEEIKKNIDFKGHNAWILIFSIIIASIGLNVNSTAVIIGAMLISPLMGPIMGIGYSIGVNDIDTLKKSIYNFIIAIVISIVTSYLYFMATPIKELTSEIFARTEPTLLDVLIAICGGLAGIIAGSRKEKSNVIPGVAIATALMPPLCTAGYGLSIGNWNFFFGAFYLLMINSVFIALSTLIVVKFLKFPLAKYLNKSKVKRTNTIISLFVVIMIIPSGIIFYNIIKKSNFKINARNFVSENMVYDGSKIITKNVSYSSDSLSIIEVFFTGEHIPEKVQKTWKSKLLNRGISNTKLIIHQSKDNIDINNIKSELRVGVIEDLYQKNQILLEKKDSTIASLNYQIKKISEKKVPFEKISNEIKAQYPDIKEVGYAIVNKTNYKTKNMTPTLLVKWKNKDDSLLISKELKLKDWIKIRLELNKIDIIRQ